MNRTISFGLIIILLLSLESCFDATKPNYQYFPNMYEPVGYETYADTDAFVNGIEAQLPVDGTVNRGWIPYDYLDSNEGYELAKANLKSPIEVNNDNLKQGKELYELAKKNNCRLLLDTCWFNKKNKFATKPLTIGDFLELKNHIIIKNILFQDKFNSVQEDKRTQEIVK